MPHCARSMRSNAVEIGADQTDVALHGGGTIRAATGAPLSGSARGARNATRPARASLTDCAKRASRPWTARTALVGEASTTASSLAQSRSHSLRIADGVGAQGARHQAVERQAREMTNDPLRLAGAAGADLGGPSGDAVQKEVHALVRRWRLEIGKHAGPRAGRRHQNGVAEHARRGAAQALRDLVDVAGVRKGILVGCREQRVAPAALRQLRPVRALALGPGARRHRAPYEDLRVGLAGTGRISAGCIQYLEGEKAFAWQSDLYALELQTARQIIEAFVGKPAVPLLRNRVEAHVVGVFDENRHVRVHDDARRQHPGAQQHVGNRGLAGVDLAHDGNARRLG